MKLIKTIAVLGLGLMVTACGQVPDIASRNAPFETVSDSLSFKAIDPAADQVPGIVQVPSFRVVQAGINVPRSLTVSEANSYYPRGDIVWRGEPFGDRHAQVEAIFEEALSRGTAGIDGDVPVIVDIQVLRFHSLSEKARVSIGGVHNMPFRMRVRHAVTGEVLMPSREIEADLDAFGGSHALMAESRGQTQKVRVTAYLAQKMRSELMHLAPQTGGLRLGQLQPRKN
ncbi:MAG: hypothetical protein P1U53_13615 [Sulfitobacter sp.]|nr:hypothetical protein [Sulfitobacter sp.]